MKYRAKGTVEAVKLESPDEVIRWVHQNLTGWTFSRILGAWIQFGDESGVEWVWKLVGAYLVKEPNESLPTVMGAQEFETWYEPVTKSYASGGYIFTQAEPGAPVITPLPSMMYDMPRSRPVEGVASAWEKK